MSCHGFVRILIRVLVVCLILFDFFDSIDWARLFFFYPLVTSLSIKVYICIYGYLDSSYADIQH